MILRTFEKIFHRRHRGYYASRFVLTVLIAATSVAAIVGKNATLPRYDPAKLPSYLDDRKVAVRATTDQIKIISGWPEVSRVVEGAKPPGLALPQGTYSLAADDRSFGIEDASLLSSVKTGRLPSAPDEIAVSRIANVRIGSTVKIAAKLTESVNLRSPLSYVEMRVVGTVEESSPNRIFVDHDLFLQYSDLNHGTELSVSVGGQPDLRSRVALPLYYWSEDSIGIDDGSVKELKRSLAQLSKSQLFADVKNAAELIAAMDINDIALTVTNEVFPATRLTVVEEDFLGLGVFVPSSLREKIKPGLLRPYTVLAEDPNTLQTVLLRLESDGVVFRSDGDYRLLDSLPELAMTPMPVGPYLPLALGVVISLLFGLLTLLFLPIRRKSEEWFLDLYPRERKRMRRLRIIEEIGSVAVGLMLSGGGIAVLGSLGPVFGRTAATDLSAYLCAAFMAMTGLIAAGLAALWQPRKRL